MSIILTTEMVLSSGSWGLFGHFFTSMKSGVDWVDAGAFKLRAMSEPTSQAARYDNRAPFSFLVYTDRSLFRV